MKKIICVLFSCLFFFSLCSCETNEYDKKYVYTDNALVGLWQEENFDEKFFQIYDFQNESQVTLSYYVYGILYDSVTCSYEVKDKNVITIFNYDEGLYFSYWFSINEKGKLAVSEDNKKSKMVLIPSEQRYNEDTSILGTWQNGRTEYEFSENGSASFEGSNVVYATKDGQLYFTYSDRFDLTAENVFICNYTIAGNTLTLTGGGQSVSFTKK